MTAQRLSSFVMPLLFATSCGGGPGKAVDVTDPDAPPALSDRQPSIPNQNPVTGSPVPDNGRPPNGSTGTPSQPPSGGGDCVSVCMSLPTRGCQAPDVGCGEGCAELLAEDCGPQQFAFARCALGVGCPDALDASPALQAQAAAVCSSQYQALRNCLSLDP